MIIDQVLEALKTKLNAHHEMMIPADDFDLHVRCVLPLPANDLAIFEFEKSQHIKIPSSYRSFLEQHNGAIVFEETTYFADKLYLYSIDELRENQLNDFPETWLLFADLRGHGEYLAFDLTQEDEIIAIGAGWHKPLQMSFVEFLYRYVQTNGIETFWKPAL